MNFEKKRAMSTGATLKSLLKDPVPDLRKIANVISGLVKRPKLEKCFLKLMTKIWSEDEDSRRILAFLNILKAIEQRPVCLSLCIKLMYVAYVKNCKFVLGSTLAHINFMRNSLIELFSKNLDEAYLHAFVYIRQLALTLRKAYTSKSKEAVQNWQFVYSLQLWTELIAKYCSTHKLLESLIHPMVQLLVGTIKLSSGERWFPLRFQCVGMLHSLAGVPTLSVQSNTTTDSNSVPLVGRCLSPTNRIFVPSLPLLLDVFQFVNFNRHASAASKAPIDIRLLLHFSPSQFRETGSLDAVVSWLFDLLVEEAALYANSTAFREFIFPLINELKQFSHTCRVASFTRQMKSLLLKLVEHSDYVEARRRAIRNLSNTNEVNQLEIQISPLDSSAMAAPFWAFYACHKEIRSKELARLTESHQKDLIPNAVQSKERKMKRFVKGDESDETESSDSDASYDYDDGKTVTHVSRSANQKNENSKTEKNSKKTMKSARGEQVVTQAETDSSDSDFNLEEALNEVEEQSEMGDALEDEVTDFELSDSDADEEIGEDIDLENNNVPEPSARKKNPQRPLKKKPSKNFPKKRPPGTKNHNASKNSKKFKPSQTNTTNPRRKR